MTWYTTVPFYASVAKAHVLSSTFRASQWGFEPQISLDIPGGMYSIVFFPEGRSLYHPLAVML
jgi:hypothetical protein